MSDQSSDIKSIESWVTGMSKAIGITQDALKEILNAETLEQAKTTAAMALVEAILTMQDGAVLLKQMLADSQAERDALKRALIFYADGIVFDGWHWRAPDDGTMARKSLAEGGYV